MPSGANRQRRLLLTTNRTLYTSLDGASIHSEEADKLHREEFLEINPADAANLRIQQNHAGRRLQRHTELVLSAALTDAVQPAPSSCRSTTTAASSTACSRLMTAPCLRSRSDRPERLPARYQWKALRDEAVD